MSVIVLFKTNGTQMNRYDWCSNVFVIVAVFELLNFFLMEFRMYVGKRFALCLGHVNINEHAAGERYGGEGGKVDGLSESVGHQLIGSDDDGGRQRDGEHDHGVGQGSGVGREVLALDDGQHGHDADVDEELRAGHRSELR